jgi:bacitracin transport system permease protein
LVDLLAVELLKMKRSRMLLLSLLGTAVAPVMVIFTLLLNGKAETPEGFEIIFYNTNLYSVLLIGVPLYSVMAAYLFSREYTEDTLKNLLTIPVSRTALMLSKMLLFFIWVLFLTLVAWVLALLLGLIWQVEGLSEALILDSLAAYGIAAALLTALSTPIIWITMAMKNYVPAIIVSISISLVNVMGFSWDKRGLLPWTAAFDIAHNSLMPAYPAAVSWTIIAVVSLSGFAGTILYFRKADID